MKKGLIFILLILFITGCAKNEHTQSEDTDTNFTTNETSSFSQQESELIRLNIGQSNYSNSMNLKGSVPTATAFTFYQPKAQKAEYLDREKP